MLLDFHFKYVTVFAALIVWLFCGWQWAIVFYLGGLFDSFEIHLSNKG